MEVNPGSLPFVVVWDWDLYGVSLLRRLCHPEPDGVAGGRIVDDAEDDPRIYRGGIVGPGYVGFVHKLTVDQAESTHPDIKAALGRKGHGGRRAGRWLAGFRWLAGRIGPEVKLILKR
jgi:hypothetical protein